MIRAGGDVGHIPLCVFEIDADDTPHDGTDLALAGEIGFAMDVARYSGSGNGCGDISTRLTGSRLKFPPFYASATLAEYAKKLIKREGAKKARLRRIASAKAAEKAAVMAVRKAERAAQKQAAADRDARALAAERQLAYIRAEAGRIRGELALINAARAAQARVDSEKRESEWFSWYKIDRERSLEALFMSGLAVAETDLSKAITAFRLLGERSMKEKTFPAIAFLGDETSTMFHVGEIPEHAKNRVAAVVAAVEAHRYGSQVQG